MACKLMISKDTFGEEDLLFDSEFQLMLRLRHPNLVQCFGYCTDPMKPYSIGIILEYIDGHTLFQLIQSVNSGERDLEMADRYEILMKASFGLLHLHQTNIVHRDSNYVRDFFCHFFIKN